MPFASFSSKYRFHAVAFSHEIPLICCFIILCPTGRWSEYGIGTDNENGNGCGGDRGREEDESYAHWYMGHTQCFRANVAYSLYGVKAGKSPPENKNGCIHANYINSFFTFQGIESFADPLGIDYESYGANSDCTRNDDPDQGGENDKQNDQVHGQQLYGDYTSSGTGCSKEGEFIIAQFQGAFCDGAHFQATTDQLQTLNSNLAALGCYQVYSSDGSNGDANNNNEMDKEEDNKGDAENSIAQRLLESSTACSTVEYGSRCPDPFSRKRQRDIKLYKEATRQFTRRIPGFIPVFSIVFCICAIVMNSLTSPTKEGNHAGDPEKRMAAPFRPIKDEDGTFRSVT